MLNKKLGFRFLVEGLPKSKTLFERIIYIEEGQTVDFHCIITALRQLFPGAKVILECYDA